MHLRTTYGGQLGQQMVKLSAYSSVRAPPFAHTATRHATPIGRSAGPRARKHEMHVVFLCVPDKVQEYILDNFWYQYNNKREEKGYMLSILNSLAEYFHLMNDIMPTSENNEVIPQKPIYVVFDGKLPGVYISFEEIVAQKIDAKLMGGLSWKKYIDFDEALTQARKILGINYYLEPAAKEYIQKCKKAKNKKAPENPYCSNIKNEGSSQKPTYKECLTKGVDPLDAEYIDWKIIEKFEEASPKLKKN
ncbi:hypothetical protein EE612_005619 [Oryza sativa]|nr:hypothetical protein EE612_005619 [Oryza sativa]